LHGQDQLAGVGFRQIKEFKKDYLYYLKDENICYISLISLYLKTLKSKCLTKTTMQCLSGRTFKVMRGSGATIIIIIQSYLILVALLVILLFSCSPQWATDPVRLRENRR